MVGRYRKLSAIRVATAVVWLTPKVAADASTAIWKKTAKLQAGKKTYEDAPSAKPIVVVHFGGEVKSELKRRVVCITARWLETLSNRPMVLTQPRHQSSEAFANNEFLVAM